MDEYWSTKLKQLGILALLAGLIWVGGWGMYHIKILSAISSVNDTCVLQPPGKIPPFTFAQESVSALSDCGTRALPYLADSLSPKKNLPYLILAGEWIRKHLEPEGTPKNIKGFKPEDTPSEIEFKCKEHQLAWKTKGAPKHKWWRWWKADDLPPQVNPDDYYTP